MQRSLMFVIFWTSYSLSGYSPSKSCRDYGMFSISMCTYCQLWNYRDLLAQFKKKKKTNCRETIVPRWLAKQTKKYSLRRKPNEEESEENEVKQNHCLKLSEWNMSQRRNDFTTDVVTSIRFFPYSWTGRSEKVVFYPSCGIKH